VKRARGAVRVSNLWVNRLIGDKDLPAESPHGTGAEHGILALPEWYRNGQPSRPQTVSSSPRGGSITRAIRWSTADCSVRLLNPVVQLLSK
jgi:hypothetical protein